MSDPTPTIRISLRAPHTTPFTPPSTAWLCAHPWHVTYSTLPLWRRARNVRITYRALASPASNSSSSSNAAFSPPLNDLVTFQNASAPASSPPKRVEGIDTPRGPGAWRWRGKGWLKIASSDWEVLGFGGEQSEQCERCESGEGDDESSPARPNDDEDNDGEDIEHAWLVTYFAKTLFTPAGIDIYSQQRRGLPPATLEAIQAALGVVEHDGVRKLAQELFVVKSDFC